MSGCHIAKTSFASASVNPIWNEHFSIPVCHQAKNIQFKIKGREKYGSVNLILQLAYFALFVCKLIADTVPLLPFIQPAAYYGSKLRSGCSLVLHQILLLRNRTATVGLFDIQTEDILDSEEKDGWHKVVVGEDGKTGGQVARNTRHNQGEFS